MKAATAGTLATLSAGVFVKAELWDFALWPPATPMYATNWDAPLTVGGHAYTTDLVIERDSIQQASGLDPGSFNITVYPRNEAANVVIVGGYPFLEACRRGFLDGCRVTLSKLFMSTAGDVSNGATPWFKGRISDVQATRFAATLTIVPETELLNVMMPRNLIQTGCAHTLYDAGCTAKRTAFTFNGTCIDAFATPTRFSYSGLTQIIGYFDLGVLTWVGGVNAGLAGTVRSYGAGSIVMQAPFPSTPKYGDTFSIVAGCDKQLATCKAKFSNGAHFRGYPFVPVPETLYDGGTYNPPATVDGVQGTSISGSASSANKYPGTYQP